MSLRRHDLNLLVILEAILREGSVSAAARRLNLTQPATSQALERARAMFGDPLMLRRGRGLVPTARGEALRDELAGVLARISGAIEGAGFDPDRAERTFTIAAGDLAEMLILPQVLPALVREAPACRFEVVPPQHDYAGDLPDVQLMGAAPTTGASLSRDLLADRFVLLARADHPALTGPLTAEAYAALPQVLVSPRGGGFSGPVDEALRASGLRRNVRLSLPRFATLPLVLAQGDLVAAVPERHARLVAAAGQCGFRDLPVEVPPFTLKLVWHPAVDRDPAGTWLRDRLGAAVGRVETQSAC